MGINDWIKGYFCSKSSTELRQVAIAFTTGLLLGPFSTSILFKILFIIVYEIILFCYTRDIKHKWRCFIRLAITCAGLYGYFLGKWLMTGKTGMESWFTYRHC